MADLAQLGLSLDAKPMLTGLEAVDQALAKTAAAADALVGKIKTATGQMAAAFSKVKEGGADKQAASMEKMNFAIEHQAKAYRALLTVMREDAAIAKSATAQRILLNSAFASATAEIDRATVAGAKNLAGLRSEAAVTTSLAVAQGGLTASEKQLLDAKIRKAAVTKAYTDSVRAEITGATQQVALSNAHVAAYHRETAAIKERNAALAAERKMQTELGRSIIALQGRQNAAQGLSSAGKDLFAPFANDPKVLAATRRPIAQIDELEKRLQKFGSTGFNVLGTATVKLNTDVANAFKRVEKNATDALKQIERVDKAKAKAASDIRLQPILSTGSTGLPTKATSAFAAGPEFTASGIASVDKMRESLARLRVEESALHSAREAGVITHKEYARGMDEVTKATNLAVAGNTRARGVFRQTASAIASATFEITGAVFGLTAAFGILSAPAAFGFKLLRTMEDTKLGMGAILISMGLINGEAIKLPKALELADGMTKRLQQNAMKYGVDMIALADTTKAVLASGLGGGLALKEVEEIALLGSIAVKTIGLDAKQSVQEIRDLVAGGIQAGSSTLAVALGIGNKQVKEWREAGTLFENLKKAMVGFQDTAILKQDTLNGAWTIFVQKVQLLLANGPAFDLIKQKLTDISNAIGGFNADTGQFEFNPELVKTVEEYYAAFKSVVGVLVEAGKLVVELIPLVIELGKAFLLLKAINLSGTLAKGLLEVGAAAASATKAIVTGVGGAKDKVTELTGVLNGIGKSPIIQVIGVEIAWGSGQWVGGKLNEFFGDFFAKELEKINKLIYNFGGSIKATLADALAAVFNWGPMSRLLGISEFFSDMADEIRRGGGTAAAAAAAQAGRIARISAQYDSKQSEGGLRSTGKINGGNDRLLAEEMALLGADRVTGKPAPETSGKKGRAGGGGADPQVAFMAGLRKEAETLGMGEEALKRYEASKMKLSAANRRLADTYISTVFGFKAEQEAAKLANEEAQKAIEADAALVKSAEDKTTETEKAIKQLQFETTLLSMNTDERYKAIAANELSENTYTKGNAALEDRVALLKKEQEQQSRITSLLANTQGAKTDDFMADVNAADTAFFRGDIGGQQYEEIIKNITDSSKEKLKELDTFGKRAAKNIQDAMADFLFNPFDKGLKGMVQSFGTMMQKMIAEAVAADLARKLFGGLSGQEGATGSGWVGAGLDWLGGMLGLANGGAFGPGGAQAFANGGIMGASGGLLTRPTVWPMANGGIGLGGEAGVEAVMPLKRGSDGKLGVAAGGGGGPRHNITVIVQGGQSAPDVRRAAGQGAREALGMINGAKRYG